MVAPSNSSGWHVPSVDELDRIFYGCGNSKNFASFGDFGSVHRIESKSSQKWSKGAQGWPDGNIDDLLDERHSMYGVDNSIYDSSGDSPWLLNDYNGNDDDATVGRYCIWTTSTYSGDSSYRWVYNPVKQCYEVAFTGLYFTLRPVFAF